MTQPLKLAIATLLSFTCLALAAPLTSASIVVGGSSLLTAGYADQLETWLGEGPIQLTKIYEKQSGDTSLDFHAAVDGQGRTFTVLQVTNQPYLGAPQIIGGYNPQSWDSSSGYHITTADADRTAFLFNLTTSEIQLQSLSTQTGSNGQWQTYNTTSRGPTFGGGHDIWVHSDLSLGVASNYTYGGTTSANNILAGTSGLTGGLVYGAIEVFTIANISNDGTVPEPLSLFVWAGLTSVAGLVRSRRR